AYRFDFVFPFRGRLRIFAFIETVQVEAKFARWWYGDDFLETFGGDHVFQSVLSAWARFERAVIGRNFRIIAVSFEFGCESIVLGFYIGLGCCRCEGEEKPDKEFTHVDSIWVSHL